MNQGQCSHQEWRDGLLAGPASHALHEEEAAKKELWLQLVEVRQQAGLMQAQIARIEKNGSASYTLTTLRR